MSNGMKVEMFMEFEAGCNIKGESKDAQHGEGKGDCLQVLNFNGGSSASSVTSGGAQGRTRAVELKDITITVHPSKASSALYKHMTLGTRIPEAKLYKRKSGGGTQGQMDFMIYTFKNLYVTNIDYTVGTEDTLEVITFEITCMHLEYKMQNQKGEVKRVGSWGYDLKENRGQE
jgi:type VI protein secretion system component Hcp